MDQYSAGVFYIWLVASSVGRWVNPGLIQYIVMIMMANLRPVPLYLGLVGTAFECDVS